MTEKHTITGDWFLPSSKNVKVHGTLKYHSKEGGDLEPLFAVAFATVLNSNKTVSYICPSVFCEIKKPHPFYRSYKSYVLTTVWKKIIAGK